MHAIPYLYQTKLETHLLFESIDAITNCIYNPSGNCFTNPNPYIKLNQIYTYIYNYKPYAIPYIARPVCYFFIGFCIRTYLVFIIHASYSLPCYQHLILLSPNLTFHFNEHGVYTVKVCFQSIISLCLFIHFVFIQQAFTATSTSLKCSVRGVNFTSSK